MTVDAPPAPRLIRTAALMGTVFSVHVVGTPVVTDAVHSAIDACFAELAEVELVFSPYRADSAVSRMRSGAAILAEVDDRVGEVAAACADAEAATFGRFSAWRAGWFDPTGYVKGWSAEAAAQGWLRPLLSLPGVQAVGLNAGGDVRLFTRADAEWEWHVGIVDPRRTGEVLATIDLRDGAVATSGLAERGPHILDPRTGRSAEAVLSATVVADDLATADVWATAAVVSGDDLSWIGAAPVASGLLVLPDGRTRRWAGGVEVSAPSW